jgi:peptidoglycan hydrolase-like protein with peptidoglycan-binding domain
MTTPDEGDTDTITMADFTGPTEDQGGGGYETYISAEEPDYDPFREYKELVQADYVPPMLAVPMSVSYKLAHNLDVRRQKIWSCWSHDVVVGWIGDAAHQSGCSDHNPDSTGVVHAIDPMVTGTRAQTIVNQALAHPGDLQYVIHNGVIWSATVGWKARKYTGSDKHTNHVHLSGKHGSQHSAAHTCTGYDLAAQASTPVFDICPPPKPPTPTPPKPKPPVAKNAPGSRILQNQNPDLSGADVVFVQKFIGSKHAGSPDGRYGDKTAAGVRWYQGMRGIHVDGIVGPKTWAQMGVKWTGPKQ